MSARAAVHGLLETHLAEYERLHDLGFREVMASNSVESPSVDRFIVVRWEDQSTTFATRGPQELSLWFHSKGRDYGPLDDAIEFVNGLLPAQVHLLGADNWILTTAEHRGISADLYDDGFGTITKYSRFRVVSRYSAPQD